MVAKDLAQEKEMSDQQQALSPEALARMPIVARITVGALQENCYIYACPITKEAVIIDPGDEAERILETIQELQVIPRYILNTHGHFDHTAAIDEISAVYPVPLAIHEADLYMYTDPRFAEFAGRPAPLVKRKPDFFLHDGDQITFGTLRLDVVFTPGHSPGGVSLVSEPYCVFSGDTLFQRGVGRYDFEYGDRDTLFHSILTRLYTLPEDLVVFSGHGDPTTIGEEKYENPFVTVEE
jgi:glyoxylase-like metal-dependent hydrolase (beta-lactamase superfamily II)